MGSCGGSKKQREVITIPPITEKSSTGDQTKWSTTPTSKEIVIAPSQFVKETTGEFKEFYEVGKKLGGGAYGQVFVCVHKATQSTRAVKVMEKTAIEESEKERFFSEIKILKMMDHPNIVKLFEVFQDKKRFYLVTELCTGGELFDKLTQGKPLDEEESANFMKQLLSAIVYCHANNVVHRDLKPENLLLESTESNAMIKVIDFGTSQIFNPTKKMTVKIGTPYYIAPEVLSQSYTEKCDIWSCGVILYILLCGYPPFVGRSDADIMSKIKKGIIKMSGVQWDEVSELAKDLVKHMLTYDPKKRYSAVDSLSHPWIKKHCHQHLDREFAKELLNTMRQFKTQFKLQEAALTYIASQLASNKEKQQLQNVFLVLDTNCDGRLSREELIEGFKSFGGSDISPEEEVNRILSHIDIDNNGYIDYTEFVLATINKKKLLTKERLRLAFAMFDKDGSGAISSDEIKAILGVGTTVPDEQWKDLIKEIDENGDGEISLQEFELMMSKLLEAN